MPPTVCRQPPLIVPVAGPPGKPRATADIGLWCDIDIQVAVFGAPRPEAVTFRLDPGSTHTVLCERHLVDARVPLPPPTGEVKRMLTSAGRVRYAERRRLWLHAWWHPDFAGDPFVWAAVVQPDPPGELPPPRLGLPAFLGCRWLLDSTPHALSGYNIVALDDIR